MVPEGHFLCACRWATLSGFASGAFRPSSTPADGLNRGVSRKRHIDLLLLGLDAAMLPGNK